MVLYIIAKNYNKVSMRILESERVKPGVLNTRITEKTEKNYKMHTMKNTNKKGKATCKLKLL